MDWLIGKSRKSKESVATENSKLYLKPEFFRERLIDGDLSPLVSLPHRVDHNEWIASNTISFFEHINAISGCLTEFCKPTTCPVMTGPNNVQYQWVDDRGKKYKCSGPQYTDYVMSFTQKCISDEAVFPTKYGNAFPVTFDKIVRKIHRLLLHVLAHVYQCHCREMSALGLRSHLNTITFHFLLFNRHFALIENKEINVFSDLFERFQSPHPRCDSVTSHDIENNSTTTSSTQTKSTTFKHLTVRSLKFRENEQNGFVRESMAALVS